MSDFLDGTVSRIDPETKAVAETVEVGGVPSGIAVLACSHCGVRRIARLRQQDRSGLALLDGTPGWVSRASGVALEDRTAWVGVRGPDSAHQVGR